MRNWRTGDGTDNDPLYVKDATNALDYQLDNTIDTSTAGVPRCADVAYTIATEFDILIDALENAGPLPTLETVVVMNMLLDILHREMIASH